MRILFLTKEIPFPLTSGGRIRSWHLIQQFAKEHEVTIVCYSTEIEERIKELGSVNVQSVDSDLSHWTGFRNYLRVLWGLMMFKPMLIRHRYSKSLTKKVREVVNAKKIDLIVCDSLFLAQHVPFESCQTVLNEHNIESNILNRTISSEKTIIKKILTWAEYIKLKNYENYIWKRFDRIFVCSSVDQQTLEKRSGLKNIDTVPNGVDIDFFALEDFNVKPLDIVFMGMLNWRPNEDGLIYFLKEIYPIVKKENFNVHFWIIGKNPPASILALCENDPSITITGFVDDVRPYVRSANAFIVPLRIGSGTRLKILEAFAMGKAVISTSIGCEGIEVEHNKNILVADNPKDFALQVVRLFDDLEKSKELGLMGRKLVEEKYSWDTIGRAVNQGITINSQEI